MPRTRAEESASAPVAEEFPAWVGVQSLRPAQSGPAQPVLRQLPVRAQRISDTPFAKAKRHCRTAGKSS